MRTDLRGPGTRGLVLGLFFLAVIVLAGGTRLVGQTTVTVGTGTTTSYQVPVNMFYMNSIVELLYTGSEITSAGWTGGAGSITNLRFNIANTYAYTPMSGSTLAIYLDNSSETSLAAIPYPGGTNGTLVWSGNHPLFNATGWWNFTLTNAFCYSGGNLYVRIVRTDFDYGSTSQTWYCSTTSSDMTRHRYWDTSVPSGNMYTTTTRPNIQLVIGTASTMAYSSSTTTQTNVNPVGVGASNQEIIGMQVVTTGCSSPMSVTSFSLSTSGSTSAADITNAKVYYTGGLSTFSPVNQFGSTVSNPSGSFTVPGNQVLQAGTNYFWLAYDIAAAATNGNVVDAQCSSITVGGVGRTPTVGSPTGSRTIMAPLSGVYTIDPNGSGNRNFTSFTGAIATMNMVGLAGATTFNVAAATYNEQLTLVPVTGASSTNTVTFDGGTGNAATRILTYNATASGDAIVTLNGADYIRFKNLTINSTNSSYGYGFKFTGQADYNEISNCVINMPANTTSSGHIGIVATSGTTYGSSGNNGNYNLIKDNEINSGYCGINWYGSSSSSTTLSKGNEFIGNTVQDWYYYGMYLYYGAATKANGNRVIQRSTGTYYTSSGYAFNWYYQNEGGEVIGNYVYGVYYVFRIYYPNQYRSSTSLRCMVSNNMVVANGTSTIYAGYLYYPRYTDFVNNTIYSKTSGTAYGIRHYTSSSSYDNKIVNNYVVHEGNSTWYPFYASPVTDMSQYDYNAYYRIGTGTPSFYWNGTTYTSLAALQTSTTGVHDNSVWGNPYFYSQTDVHSNSHVGYQAGIAFTGVTDDFDGDLRGLNPCIGADEYPAPPPEYDLSVAEVMLDNADNKWAHREAPDEHAVKVVLENTGLSTNPSPVTVTYKIGSMPADVTDGVQQTFTPGWIGRKAAVEFTQKATGFVAGSNVVVYARVFWAADEVASNDGSLDNAYVETWKVHGIENFEKLEAGAFPLSRDPGYLDLPWDIIDNNGGATLAVTPATGNGGGMGLSINTPTELADEWIVTPGADLLAGSSYRLGFDFRNWGGSPVTIEAAWGNTPDPSQMTVFATYANINPGSWVTAKQLGGNFDPYFNTPLYNGTFFVALRFTTSGTNAYFSVDNIKLDDNPSPPPKIAFGLPGTDLSTFIDNPASKLTILANYKQPGIINRTYEVQSKTNIYGINGDFLWDVETSTPWISLTKETPNPTMQNYQTTPPRPRQYQTFTMSVNTSGLAAGTHMGEITFYGILFNDDFPPPANGLVATNEPLTIQVELIITNAGSKTGGYIEQTISTPLTVPGSPYDFTDPKTGDPIATVVVTSGQIDAMTIRAYPNQLPQNLQRKLFVKRYWQITHTGTGWTADITFPYADIEASMITDKLQLRGVRQPVTLGAWEDPIAGTGSVSDPATNRVTVTGFNDMNIGGNIALAQPYMTVTKSGPAVQEFSLGQNYPNPFNPSTSIVFTVGEERAVRLAVYDALGAEVAVLVNDVLTPGRYEVAFDASDLPSGTYVYRMLSGAFTATQRMTLSK